MKFPKNFPYTPREISWLSFNGRVLQEAADETVPLIERIKFLGIFSNNLDEFFRVRVATLKRMESFRKTARELIGENPTTVLRKIHTIVLEQQKKFESIYEQLIAELSKNKIHILNEKQLSAEQGDFVRKYFHETVLPTLAPVMIETANKFPYLKDKSIYFAIKLSSNLHKKYTRYALIQIPTDVLSRFLILPKDGEKRYIMLLDDVIRYCLPEVFSIFEFDKAEAYTIKMTRDAELEMDNDLSKSMAEKISKSLKQRKRGKPVRMVYDQQIPPDLLNFILKKTKMKKKTLNLIPGGRYHNFKDFIKFPNVGRRDLLYNRPKPLQHPALAGVKSIFKVINKKDVLLSYPYQSFNHIIDLLREASIDPKVTSIKITLYRVAPDSNVVYALTNAVKNGKDVTVVVELQARFDEEANIYWANQLQEEGAKVIYGVPGLKVHSKLFLITRRDEGKTKEYAHIGTGNFNEATAGLYCDHSLLTADERITSEVARVFNFYSNNFKTGSYKDLAVSPFFMRKKFLKLIHKEMKNAREGKPAWIILKLNSLGDVEMIKRLYQASEEGVKIKLIVRSNFSLVPGVVKLSENIEAMSLVDKNLEHARVFVFCNNGDEKVYISSADWMVRNFDQRSEVAVPIFDKRIRQELIDLLNIQLADNVKSRVLDGKQRNIYKFAATGDKKVRAQDEIYTYFKNKANNPAEQ